MCFFLLKFIDMKLAFIISFLFVFSLTAQKKNSEVGWMFTDLLVDGNLYFSYERAINESWSWQINGGYKLPAGLVNISGIDAEQLQTSDINYTGFKITPSVKYYINSVRPDHMDGFYVGGYTKYGRYHTDIGATFIDSSDQSYSLNFNTNMNLYSLGIMIGYKLPVSDRLAIDFLFLGFGKGWYSFNVKSETSVPDEFYDYLNDQLDKITLLDLINSDFSFSEINTRSSFFGSAARYGITLTYAF